MSNINITFFIPNYFKIEGTLLILLRSPIERFYVSGRSPNLEDIIDL